MKLSIFSFILLTIFSSCSTSKLTSLSEEINSLKTNESKKAFLEHILEVDQAQRQGQDVEIMLKYGKNSKEAIEYGRKFMKQDSLNLEKIELYIKKYGYPNIEILGKDAALTPWLVIHHCNGLDVRERNYKILKKAFEDGNITDRQFILYLNRWHQIKLGQRLILESPYRIEDELKAYEKALNLKDL